MKKNKLLVVLSVILIVSALLSGCTKANAEVTEEQVRAVKVMKIQENKNPVALSYVGTVDSKEIVNYSFKTGGKIGKIYVDEGQSIRKGQILAELDKQDSLLQLDAAKLNIDNANINISKAEDSLKYSKDTLDRIERLFAEGGVSKDQYDQAKLQYDLAKSTYDQAKAQYDILQTDYEYKQSLHDGASIHAEQDGNVVKLINKEGEYVGAQSPIISIRSSIQIVNIGIPQKDLKAVKKGAKAIVNVEGENIEGIITNIAEAPDEATRTYKAEITVPKDKFRLGSIANVEIGIGEKQGIWIPMTSVFSNGEDYVYIIKEDRAFKRVIEIKESHEDKLLVSGINSGEQLAVSGMKNLNDGAKIKVVE